MPHLNLPEAMTVLVWEAPSKMALHQQALPELKPEEVLVKVAYAGICGSELSGYLGHNALRVPPLVMGHEFSGTIVTVGEQVSKTYPGLVEGTRVTANPLLYCGECDYCRQGVNQLCVERKLIGAHRPGAFASYVSVPAKQIVLLPDGLSFQDGALAEPAACGVRIGELAGSVGGEAALVIGAGTIGLMALQALRNLGAARVFIADIHPDRLAAGSKLGGEPINPKFMDVVRTVRQATENYGAKVVVDAVGLESTREQAVQSTRSTGTVILSGLHEETSLIPASDIIRREIAVKGSFAYSPANFAQSVRDLAEKKLSMDGLTIEADLSEGGRWFDQLVDGSVGKAKVLLAPQR